MDSSACSLASSRERTERYSDYIALLAKGRRSTRFVDLQSFVRRLPQVVVQRSHVQSHLRPKISTFTYRVRRHAETYLVREYCSGPDSHPCWASQILAKVRVKCEENDCCRMKLADRSFVLVEIGAR